MRKLFVFMLAAALSGAVSLAQTKKAPPEGSAREEALEKSVHITSGPTVSNVTATSATITWTTNKNGATDVKYGYDNGHWRTAFKRGGAKDHSVTLSALKPGKTYTYKIMTREQEVRTSGTFQTPKA